MICGATTKSTGQPCIKHASFCGMCVYHIPVGWDHEFTQELNEKILKTIGRSPIMVTISDILATLPFTPNKLITHLSGTRVAALIRYLDDNSVMHLQPQHTTFTNEPLGSEARGEVSRPSNVNRPIHSSNDTSRSSNETSHLRNETSQSPEVSVPPETEDDEDDYYADIYETRHVPSTPSIPGDNGNNVVYHPTTKSFNFAPPSSHDPLPPQQTEYSTSSRDYEPTRTHRYHDPTRYDDYTPRRIPVGKRGSSYRDETPLCQKIHVMQRLCRLKRDCPHKYIDCKFYHVDILCDSPVNCTKVNDFTLQAIKRKKSRRSGMRKPKRHDNRDYDRRGYRRYE